ncbi:hypothetical protein EVAR_56499_1 [Eumeta japonica]|uniref:Uncharacterized protein n=1 Tax=Eumeta variegata TaxID=151549 RepID=A0A4C1XIY5_EUMVA|nr:hypothetical protein EVAR_56499_1 [Eumeta japonica]
MGKVQRTKLCRSELAANYVLRRCYAPLPFLLLRRVPILRHRDAFMTNFTAAKFQCQRFLLQRQFHTLQHLRAYLFSALTTWERANLTAKIAGLVATIVTKGPT